MPTSITQYQIRPNSDSTHPSPLPSPPLPPLPVFASDHLIREITNAPKKTTQPLSTTYVHAQLLDPSSSRNQDISTNSQLKKPLIPSLIERFKENPLTAPLQNDSVARSNNWKTHIGVSIASFFIGASFAIILMLYLY